MNLRYYRRLTQIFVRFYSFEELEKEWRIIYFHYNCISYEEREEFLIIFPDSVQ
jgi:hypothetical protein